MKQENKALEIARQGERSEMLPPGQFLDGSSSVDPADDAFPYLAGVVLT